tara:strand:- start:237 stop:1226 length:990 start_codon:yes stop_codon:yes gene_type:complete
MSNILTTPNTAIKKYIFIIFITSTLLVLSVVGTNHASIQNGGTGITELDLYRYQMIKLDSSKDVEMIFVGDSSLGNAIDAEYFSDLSGIQTLNLALTGTSYGLLGSYNMIRHSVERQPIKTAIIMQSLDIFSEKVSHIGYFHTLTGLVAPDEIPINISTYFDVYFNIGIFYGIFKDWKSSNPNGMIAEVIDNDYIKQGPKMDLSSMDSEITQAEWQLDSIIKDRFVALKLIADYCKKNGINCIFTTSPHLEQACKDNPDYIAKIMNLSISSGINTLPNQVCYPSSHVGDSLNHVNKEVKRVYTELYYNKLQKYKQFSFPLNSRTPLKPL